MEKLKKKSKSAVNKVKNKVNSLEQTEVNIVGRNFFEIYNIKKIITCTNEEIKIQVFDCIIYIEGNSMEVDILSKDRMTVYGKIKSINFIEV